MGLLDIVTVAVCAICYLSPLSPPPVDAVCNLPQCRNKQENSANKVACKPFYLLPGKSNDCSKAGANNRILNIDPSSVQISPNPIRLPGCFTMQMNIEMLPNKLPASFLSKIEYNWWNLPQFSSLACQNQSSNGCGGYGNNCFYCDICNSLQELKTNEKLSTDQLARQFSDLECPTKPGVYKLKREFCFNDFSEFDKNNNCQLDFLENDDIAKQYKEALSNLQQAGYGSVIAKFTLSTNATDDQQKQKFAKEQEIDQSIDLELQKKRQENNWEITDTQYITFRNWYTQFRKDSWHRQEYLPWLLYFNEIGCITVSFNVCDKEPTPLNGQTWQCV